MFGLRRFVCLLLLMIVVFLIGLLLVFVGLGLFYLLHFVLLGLLGFGVDSFDLFDLVFGFCVSSWFLYFFLV